MNRKSTVAALAVALAAGALAGVLVACGTKKPPEPAHVEVDASAPVDAAPPEMPEAAPPEAAPPPKTYGLCSVGGDAVATKQCLVWTGCAGGMTLTLRGKPFRKCAAKQSECEETEEKLVMASQRIAPGARTCKTKFYLAKEVAIGDATWRVCPEDAEDKELSALWKRIVPGCREPYQGN